MTKSLVIDGLSMVALSTFNEDWLGWPDAPGGEQFEAGFGAQYDADADAKWRAGIDWKAEAEADFMAASHEYGEDVDFAQAQMVAECAEASWHRFSCS